MLRFTPRLPRRFGRCMIFVDGIWLLLVVRGCMIVAIEEKCYISPSARREDEAKGLEILLQQPNRSATRNIFTLWRTTFCSVGKSATMSCSTSGYIPRFASATSCGSAGRTCMTRKGTSFMHTSSLPNTKPAKTRLLP